MVEANIYLGLASIVAGMVMVFLPRYSSAFRDREGSVRFSRILLMAGIFLILVGLFSMSASLPEISTN